MNQKSDILGLQIESTDTDKKIPPPPRKFLSRLVLPLGILIAALILLGYAARDSFVPAIDVRTVPVVSKSFSHTAGTVTLQAPGWVEPDPFPIYVPALAPGVVKEVLVLEGDTVIAGQVVARMIDDDARLALQLAQAKLDNRQALLRAAQADWDNPVELDRKITVTEASLKENKAERAQFISEIAMHQAQVVELKDMHGRLANVDPDAVAQQQVLQADLQHKAQLARLEVAQKKLDVIDAGYLGLQAELHASKEQRRLRIFERKAIDLAKAELQESRVALAQAQLRLDRMEIRSPVSGIVMTRLVVPGSKLMLDMDGKLSANAVHLYDPNRLQVRVDIPLADAAKVGIGQEVEIVVDVLPDKRFKGMVSRIVHEADIQKNTLEAKVAIHNPTEQLKPEMLARVKFLGQSQSKNESTSHRVLVPERILQQRSGQTAVVWVVTVDKRAAQRDITLGRYQQDGWIETVSGLQPGDTLIAEYEKPLTEGKRIRITGEIEL